MDKESIARINELARKSRSEGLTPEETAEQQALRKEYLVEFRENMRQVLDGIIIQEPDGTRHKLTPKDRV